MRYEDEGKFLEGTGSIVFDYQGETGPITSPIILWFSGKVAYACESVRTHPEVLQDLCKQLQFEPVLLQAIDKQGTDKVQNSIRCDEPLPQVARFTTPTCSCPS